MTCTLSESERRICGWLAKSRHEAARRAGVVNAKVGPQSNEQTDLDGIGGEFAFCKMANVWPDMDVFVRAGGYDCILRSGLTCDIKTTSRPDGRLIATQKKTPADSDIYVLMTGHMPTFAFAGWASAADLLRPENLVCLRPGTAPVYGLTQDKLRDYIPK